MLTELAGLNEEQAVLFLKVRAEALRDDRPVSELLLMSDAAAEDQAAVADRFCAGAGADYLS